MASLNYSRQREAVLRFMKSTKTHPTAEQVYKAVREDFPKISLATVYRNLNLLVEHGQLRRLNSGNGVDHFDAVLTAHNHFVCRQCGRMFDLEAQVEVQVEPTSLEGFSGEMEEYQLFFYGICQECKK
ncbi:MAG: transcriptional repressor [Eubacterium sp.]|nr:transcriptional repressor [Eubacterium sp.]